MILDGMSIPKFMSSLSIPSVFAPEIIKDKNTNEVISHNYVINVSRFFQQMLPCGFPKTELFGYGGEVYSSCCINQFCRDTSVPGPTIVATRGVQVNIKWQNNLSGPHPLAVDPTICWADPNSIGMIEPENVPSFPPGLEEAQAPIPIVTHLHGGEVNSIFDGHPEAWFTKGEKKVGPKFVTSTVQYPNKQPSMNLWYHDHTLGMTRLNVYCGLYGAYIIKDLNNSLDKPGVIFPSEEYDIPLVIKDYTFNDDGSLWFSSEGTYPDIHPYWCPEFFGNAITVNGKTWPYLNVERTVYRFRILNGSNSRFYNISFSNKMPFIQIGSDGGYLKEPVILEKLLIAPAERMDILVNFSYCKQGAEIIMGNHAPAPFPNGSNENYDPETTGVIMKFNVCGCKESIKCRIPKILNRIPELKPNSKDRILVLTECTMNEGSPGLYLNGQKYMAPVSEMPLVGATEEWSIVNLTADAHPIHLHLVQFIIKNRQNIDSDGYWNEWLKVNGMPPLTEPTVDVPIEPYLLGNPMEPSKTELGWKDTSIVMPGEVIRILVRFAPQNVNEEETMPGINMFPFNPSIGPGYMWHCHILDHEDNEMMRPMMIMNEDMSSDGTMNNAMMDILE